VVVGDDVSEAPGDDRGVDGGRLDEGKMGVWSMLPLASESDEEVRLEWLRATATAGDDGDLDYLRDSVEKTVHNMR
jgi:hypothetical protein